MGQHGDERILAQILTRADAPAPAALESAARGREVGAFRVWTGWIRAKSLEKAAAAPGVVAVISGESLAPAWGPELDVDDEETLAAAGVLAAPAQGEDLRALIRDGGKDAFLRREIGRAHV